MSSNRKSKCAGGFRRGFLLSRTSNGSQKRDNKTGTPATRKGAAASAPTPIIDGVIAFHSSSSNPTHVEGCQKLRSPPQQSPLSSTLLDWENPEPNSWLLLSPPPEEKQDAQQDPCQMPQHVLRSSLLFVDDNGTATINSSNVSKNIDNDPIFGISEIASKRRITTQVATDMLQTQEAPNITSRVLQNDRFTRQQNELLSAHATHKNRIITSKTDQPQSKVNFEEERTILDSNSPLTHIQSSSPPQDYEESNRTFESTNVVTTTDFVKCQQRLDRTLWRLRRWENNNSNSTTKKKCARKGDDTSDHEADDQQWRAVAQEFCLGLMRKQQQQASSSHDHQHDSRFQQLHWVWQALVTTIASTTGGRGGSHRGSHSLAEQRLGVLLLENTTTVSQWDVVAGFLQPSQDKRSRVLTLGAIAILEFWGHQQHQRQYSSLDRPPQSAAIYTGCNNDLESSLASSPGELQHRYPKEQWMVDLLTHIVPLLVRQIVQNPETRTMLSQRCLMLLYEIIATAAEFHNSFGGGDEEQTMRLESVLWQSCGPALERVWEVHVNWSSNNARAYGCGSTVGQDLGGNLKSCLHYVLLDWQRCYRRWRELEACACHNANPSSAGTVDSASSKPGGRGKGGDWRMTKYWCNFLMGNTVEALDRGLYRTRDTNGTRSCAQIGSLRQTLVSDSKGNRMPLNGEDIVPCLKRALMYGRAWQEKNTIGNKRDCHYYGELQIAVFRGLLAWLGQNRQHLSRILEAEVSQNQEWRLLMGFPTVVEKECNGGGDHQPLYQTMFELATCSLLYPTSDTAVEFIDLICNILRRASTGMLHDVDTSSANAGDILKGYNVKITYHIITLLHHNDDECRKRPKDSSSCGDSSACDDVLKHSSGVLGSLVARFIVDLCDTGRVAFENALETLLAPVGVTDLTADVLSKILDCLQPLLPLDSSGKDASLHQQLYDHICCDLLVLNVESNTAALGTVRYFYKCSAALMVSKQVLILSNIIASQPSSNSQMICQTVDALVESMTSSLELHLDSTNSSQEGSCVIDVIVETMIALTGNDGTSLSAQGTDNSQIVEKLCSRLCESWRRSLLKTRLHLMLESVGKAMFKFPASSVPLTLFGKVVGDDDSYSVTRQPQEKPSACVLKAAVSLIKLTVHELDSLDSTQSQNDIFHRLAPLLLLRRTPVSFFSAAYEENRGTGFEQHELHELLSRLAGRLSARLDIGEKICFAPYRSDVTFSSEERRLAAEIAGRSLPFHEGMGNAGVAVDFPALGALSSTFSCFQRICLPAFSGALALLTKAENTRESNNTENRGVNSSPMSNEERMRTARAALYAACHFVPTARLDAGPHAGWAVIATAEFCLTFLNADQHEVKGAQMERDIMQLQAGSIEYFAICIEKLLSYRVPPKRSNCAEHALFRQQNGPLRGSEKLEDYLDDILQQVLEILQTGKDNFRSRFDEVTTLLGAAGAGEVIEFIFPQSSRESCYDRSFSVPCRTCLLNAMIVVAQRCNPDGQLQYYAQTTLPWIFRWASTFLTSNDNGDAFVSRDCDIAHPLYLTATLQLCFILVTRTKSFDSEGVAEGNAGARRNALFLFKLAAMSIKRFSAVLFFPAAKSLRSAALKLILAVISVDQLHNEESKHKLLLECLDPSELGDVAELIRGMSEQDADPRLIALARQTFGS